MLQVASTINIFHKYGPNFEIKLCLKFYHQKAWIYGGLIYGLRRSWPSGGKISNKVLSQILVHFMKKYIKFRSFQALEEGF